MTSLFEYISLKEPIKPIGTIRVDIFWHKSKIFIKRNCLKYNSDSWYSKREPMFTDVQVDKLINVEWIYYEDV